MPQAQGSQTGELTGSLEWSKARRAAVLAELNRILADPAFSKSKRCGDLLRCLVEHALSGSQQGIKERTLGVEVFGREADYDNNADPVVRRTASEIRKRLAQYYQDLDERQAVKIHLTAGSYLPEFDFGVVPVIVSTPYPEMRGQISPDVVPSEPHKAPASGHGRLRLIASRRLWIALSALVLLVVVAGVTLQHSDLLRSSQYLFWRPLLQTKDPPIICVADDDLLEWNGRSNSGQAQTIATIIASRGTPESRPLSNVPRAIPYVDANVAHQLAEWMTEHGRSTVLQPASMLTLQELRHRPAVLIGGFDNPWTLTLLSGLRFSPRVDPDRGALWIRDAQNTNNHDWTFAGKQGENAPTDYAVITRLFDSETGNWIVAVAGLGQHGTDAASQFLIDPSFETFLPRKVRSQENLQVVIKTNLIKGNTGPPQFVAFHTW